MAMLYAGVLLWMATHFMPTLGAGLRQSVIDRIGFNGWRGIFSLSILCAMALMIFGWRSAQPATVYLPDPGLRMPAIGLAVIAIVLFGASNRPSRIGRIIRHPQLTGVLCWSIAHLLANGDNRSLALFGGFAIWSVLEIILISRREGAWQKKEAPGWGVEIIGIVIPLVIAAALIYFHQWFSGMPLLPS